MAATADDYAWIDSWGNGLFENAYCLTLVRGLTAETVLDRLAARGRIHHAGAAATVQAAYDAWDAAGLEELLVPVAEVDGWALLFEANGFVGVTPDLMAPVSAGTTVVGHFRNVNAFDQFLWLEDGELLVQFEPLFPESRHGARAEHIVTELRAVGFELDDPEADIGHPTRAAFALAERLTGVRVTSTLLDGAAFVAGFVRLPR